MARKVGNRGNPGLPTQFPGKTDPKASKIGSQFASLSARRPIQARIKETGKEMEKTAKLG